MRRHALLASSLLLAACQTETGPVGEAVATITQVPAQVLCVQIQVVGFRTTVRSFDVMPGQSSVESLQGLPAGSDTFSASAFAVACSASAGALASWQSDPVVAVIAAGAVTPLKLSLHPIGSASVGVDFVDAAVATAPVDAGTKLPDLAVRPPDLLPPPPDLTVPASCAGPQTCTASAPVCCATQAGSGPALTHCTTMSSCPPGSNQTIVCNTGADCAGYALTSCCRQAAGQPGVCSPPPPMGSTLVCN
jgi:hypothetical protein